MSSPSLPEPPSPSGTRSSSSSAGRLSRARTESNAPRASSTSCAPEAERTGTQDTQDTCVSVSPPSVLEIKPIDDDGELPEERTQPRITLAEMLAEGPLAPEEGKVASTSSTSKATNNTTIASAGTDLEGLPINARRIDASEASQLLRDINSQNSGSGRRHRQYDTIVSAAQYPSQRKWLVLIITFVVQVSMNFNAASYGFATEGMQHEFGVSDSTTRIGQGAFLITYAFGCELWAPFSEEFGRWPVMQASLWCVNLFALLAALAPSPAMVLAARVLGGLSSAGGSVTLGVVADMYGPWVHQYALGFIVLASCGGSVVGPLVGAPVKAFVEDWRWVFWVQFIFGAFTALVHCFFCPETDEGALVSAAAKKIRRHHRQTRQVIAIRQPHQQQDDSEVYGPHDKRKGRFAPRTLATIMLRPFRMLATEYIVLALSLLSGFSDALVFTCFESYELVLGQWHFSTLAKGLAFAPILVGNIVAFALHCFDFHFQRRQIARLAKQGRRPSPERRLFALLIAGPLLPIGLFIFASTSTPDVAHWAVPLFGSALVGIANFAIYMTTIDYMVASYGKRYAASATGGNGFCRDLLAGVSAWYARPLYQNLGPHMAVQKGSFVLAGLATGFVVPVYVFYFKGQWFRERSMMAEGLAEDDAEVGKEGKMCQMEVEEAAVGSRPVIVAAESAK